MKTFTHTDLGFFKDSHLDKSYRLVRASARDVAAYLQANLKKKKINPADFNIHEDMDDPNKPPVEIYEYQNFFLMERKDGELILLDGFRRLLYSTPPDHIINIRVYSEAEMSKQDIMKLMVFLNHFKFYGISNYYDRGFALTMYVLFGLDIPSFIKMFDAYLRSEDDTSAFYLGTHTVSRGEAIRDVSELLCDPLFVDNMLFLQEWKQTPGVMANVYFAAWFREFSLKYRKPITVKEFTKGLEGDKNLKELMVKYAKVGASSNSDSTKVVRQIKLIYQRQFSLLLGEKVEETYTEIVNRMKAEVARLKKDKTLTKLTKMKYGTTIMPQLAKMIQNGEKLEFIMVVHPFDNLTFGREDGEFVAAEPGVYTDFKVDVKMSGHGIYNKPAPWLTLLENGKERAYTRVSYGSYSTSTTVYEYLDADHIFFKKVTNQRVPSVKIDVFVRKTFTI